MKAMRILWPWFLLVADASDAGIPACAVKGVSFSDPTVQTLNGGQPMDAITCQKACAFTASCAHFTYYTDSKGCWLLTAAAQLNEKGDDAFRPSEIYAISGPKECPPAQIKKKNVTDDVHPDAEGHYTVAPGVEISPTGPSRWDGSRGEESASGGEEDECG
ncbi:APPLE domain-containing protein [Durusdinium trenchii]|uniref:APPLE domain-containing protein n=1 Tax=Durusdinium trenchii TaxID=1381693 RepID=A0ABP0KF33_9DINO